MDINTIMYIGKIFGDSSNLSYKELDTTDLNKIKEGDFFKVNNPVFGIHVYLNRNKWYEYLEIIKYIDIEYRDYEYYYVIIQNYLNTDITTEEKEIGITEEEIDITALTEEQINTVLRIWNIIKKFEKKQCLYPYQSNDMKHRGEAYFASIESLITFNEARDKHKKFINKLAIDDSLKPDNYADIKQMYFINNKGKSEFNYLYQFYEEEMKEMYSFINNNLSKTKTKGITFIPLRRYLPENYGDSKQTIKKCKLLYYSDFITNLTKTNLQEYSEQIEDSLKSIIAKYNSNFENIDLLDRKSFLKFEQEIMWGIPPEKVKNTLIKYIDKYKELKKLYDNLKRGDSKETNRDELKRGDSKETNRDELKHVISLFKNLPVPPNITGSPNTVLRQCRETPITLDESNTYMTSKCLDLMKQTGVPREIHQKLNKLTAELPENNKCIDDRWVFNNGGIFELNFDMTPEMKKSIIEDKKPDPKKRQLILGGYVSTTSLLHCSSIFKANTFINENYCDIAHMSYTRDLNKVHIYCQNMDLIFPIRIINGKLLTSPNMMYMSNTITEENNKNYILIGSFVINMGNESQGGGSEKNGWKTAKPKRRKNKSKKMNGKHINRKKNKLNHHNSFYYILFLLFDKNNKKIITVNYTNSIVMNGTILPQKRSFYIEMNILMYYKDLNQETKSLYFYKVYDKHGSDFSIYVSKFNKIEIYKKYKSFGGYSEDKILDILSRMIPVNIKKTPEKNIIFSPINNLDPHKDPHKNVDEPIMLTYQI